MENIDSSCECLQLLLNLGIETVNDFMNTFEMPFAFILLLIFKLLKLSFNFVILKILK